MSSTRGRGRPRGASDARSRIAAAAVHEFGEHGYDGATIRGIAARAEVDSALVHHYFGTKADLFAEAAGFPVRPDIEVPVILREFQAVQFMPLLVFPQIILGGLFMPRDQMPDVLHADLGLAAAELRDRRHRRGHRRG